MKQILIAVLIFALYFLENITINILTKIVGMNPLIATALSVLIFSVCVFFIVKKAPFRSKANTASASSKNKDSLMLFIATAVLMLINLYPFDVKFNLDAWNVVIQMFFVGAVEELIFRGYVFHFFEKKKNYKYAIILSSLCFGLIHFTNFFNDYWLLVLLQILCATCIGIVYSITYHKTRKLYLCILCHALSNISANIGSSESLEKEFLFSVVCILLAVLFVWMQAPARKAAQWQ